MGNYLYNSIVLVWNILQQLDESKGDCKRINWLVIVFD